MRPPSHFGDTAEGHYRYKAAQTPIDPAGFWNSCLALWGCSPSLMLARPRQSTHGRLGFDMAGGGFSSPLSSLPMSLLAPLGYAGETKTINLWLGFVLSMANVVSSFSRSLPLSLPVPLDHHQDTSSNPSTTCASSCYGAGPFTQQATSLAHVQLRLAVRPPMCDST